MKRLTFGLFTAVLLAGCSYTPQTVPDPEATSFVAQPVVVTNQLQVMRDQQIEIAKANQLWNVKVPAMLQKLKNRIGKTWYVFSGSTPSGWDCSGLTMWAYQQLGYSIKHSATAQGHLGHYVKDPLPGDIVVWGDRNWSVHSAIYYGNGLAIHAGLHAGKRTSFISVNDRVDFLGFKAKFVRVLPNPVKPVN
jgi:cell wall-associated NlpC family hydrolase